MKNTYWDAIEPGDVVSFIYKGQQDDAKSARRIVICLDPRLEYRKKSTNRIVDYFVGLEIFNSQKSNLNPTVIKQTFDILSRRRFHISLLFVSSILASGCLEFHKSFISKSCLSV